MSSVTCNGTGNRIEVLSNNAKTSTETKSKSNSAMQPSLIRSLLSNRIPAQGSLLSNHSPARTKTNHIPKGPPDVAASGQQASVIKTKPDNNEEFENVVLGNVYSECTNDSETESDEESKVEQSESLSEQTNINVPQTESDMSSYVTYESLVEKTIRSLKEKVGNTISTMDPGFKKIY